MLESRSTHSQVLLVDDDETGCTILALTLRRAGVKNVHTISDSRQVLPFLKEHGAALVLLDLVMPYLSGYELLSAIRCDYPYIQVVVVSGADDLGKAVECMKLGANDYLSKPFEVSRLIACVTNILASCAMQSDLLSLKRRMLENTIDYPIAFEAIKTRSSKMRALFQYTEVVACSTQPILITGETGVGKELVAHALHRLSCVAGQMICINVAGLDDATFSDTLFGHTKGAFTGAESAREGLVARAAGGTLILDEIGDMDERSQIKLLRLLQEGEYYPIGSDRLHKTTARVVAVTNQNLRERVTEKQFRKDLYYRLCIHEIHIPPLRDRYEDIPLLLEHFLQEAAQAYHKKPPSVTVSATSYLLGCCFPGNIRELKAMIFDAVARNSEADLTAQSFGGSAGGVTTVLGEVPLSNNILHEIDAIFGHFPTFHEIQSYLIDEALLRSAGNLNVAADMLGITRQTISNRIKSSGSPVKTTKSKVLSKPTT